MFAKLKFLKTKAKACVDENPVHVLLKLKIVYYWKTYLLL